MLEHVGAVALSRVRLNRPLKISGRPSRLTSEPTTIIVTPHQSDHWFTISAREIGTTTPFSADARHDVAGLDHDRRENHEIDERAEQAAGRHRDAHEAADAEHRHVEREAQPELADVGAEDRRDVFGRLADRGVVVRVEPLVERPRLLHARPLVHAQDLELEQLHPAVADDGLVDRGEQRRVAEQRALNMPAPAAPV